MTSKKNASDEIRNEYSPKGLSFRKWLLSNLFVVAGIIMAIVNIWLSTKLYPLATGILELDIRVNAVEKTIADTPTAIEFNLINQRLDRIQSSLNTLIELHLKQ